MLFDRTTFFIRERVALVKLKDTYDILDPATQQPIGIAKEEPPGWAIALRLLLNKRMLPTVVSIYEQEGGPPALTIRRPFTFLRAVVSVFDREGHKLGHFRSKLFSLGGGFWVHDALDQQVAEVRGDWKGWSFRFLGRDGRELGVVTKKWAGIGKELFTSADSYVVSLKEDARPDPDTRALLLAAGLAIDVVFKER
jgi:uncharacterized protein YxjI